MFVYGYCFYYYYARSGMSGFMQTSFFFGYNLMVSSGVSCLQRGCCTAALKRACCCCYWLHWPCVPAPHLLMPLPVYHPAGVLRILPYVGSCGLAGLATVCAADLPGVDLPGSAHQLASHVAERH